jgi:peptidoglycan/xylan/chitin deacetylase (PgdA/CDA1 family)
MKQTNFPHRSPTTPSATGYLERLSKALPGAKSRAGSKLSREFWPEGAKLVISISLQFEAGAQPQSEAISSFPDIDSKYPDLPTEKWYDYGVKEGIPRLLDVFQRRRVLVTSHMVGAAVDRNPELAREIVQRGHEAAAHGQTWTPQYPMTAEEERGSYRADIKNIERATGTRPVGFTAFGLRNTPHTLEILQDLGFLYHIDDLSRDEPFVISVREKPFVVVPYTIGLNDRVLYEHRNFSTEQYASELRNEFEMLYTEAESKRRMMSISVHDRVAGRPARAKVLEEFIIYAQRRPGVVFMRKDEIANFALSSAMTPHQEETVHAADAA